MRRGASNSFDFDVTVKSVDKGTGYYADVIEILAPDGKLLGRRELLHPHEDEQPFTRDVYGGTYRLASMSLSSVLTTASRATTAKH